MCFQDNLLGDHLLLMFYLVTFGIASSLVIYFWAQAFDQVLAAYRRNNPRRNRRWARALRREA